MPSQGRSEVLEWRRALLEQAGDRSWIFRSECLPRALRQLQLLSGHALTHFVEPFDFLRRERRDISVDHDNRQRFAARGAAPEEVEELDQLKLVVQIVFEPEHHLVEIIEVTDHAVTLREVATHVREVVPALLRDEARATLAQLLQRQRRINGTFVKHVAPGYDLPLDAGLAQRAGGAIPIGDVQALRQRQGATGRYVCLS